MLLHSTRLALFHHLTTRTSRASDAELAEISHRSSNFDIWFVLLVIFWKMNLYPKNHRD
ncbi:hypothetical protein B0H12DRAFT_1137768, partial [Mycena haematopus]